MNTDRSFLTPFFNSKVALGYMKMFFFLKHRKDSKLLLFVSI
jgi:hypothetical protein